MSRERRRAVAHGLARSELFRLWEDTVRERDLSVPNPTSALDGALTIRCDSQARCLLMCVQNGGR